MPSPRCWPITWPIAGVASWHPGAIIVGGGMLAKTLYDRRQGAAAAKSRGKRKVHEQAVAGSEETDPIVT